MSETTLRVKTQADIGALKEYRRELIDFTRAVKDAGQAMREAGGMGGGSLWGETASWKCRTIRGGLAGDTTTSPTGLCSRLKAVRKWRMGSRFTNGIPTIILS